MIELNELGYLMPVKKIEVTLEEVLEFSNDIKSDTREFLSDNLETLINYLTKNTSHPCHIWIHGSYATTKANPGDIDIKVFLHKEDNEKLMEYIVEMYANKERFSMDIDFHKFNLINLSGYDEALVKSLESLALNRTLNNELREKVSGYFQINLL